jgi:hypothetical protein
MGWPSNIAPDEVNDPSGFDVAISTALPGLYEYPRNRVKIIDWNFLVL